MYGFLLFIFLASHVVSIAELFDLLYTPGTWSDAVNTVVYDVIAITLKAGESLNIPTPGGRKYNVPTTGTNPGLTPPPITALTSYSQVAISGADDFVDDSVTIKDVFDIIVSNTRDITPTCEFSIN